MKTIQYFIPIDGAAAESIFYDQDVVCLSENEVYRLNREWGKNLFNVMREATPEEIKQFGTYDND